MGHRTRAVAMWIFVAGGCATTQRRSPELEHAHAAYDKAALGTAPARAPLDLEEARVALARADHAFANEQPEVASELAYVAERKAQLAQARADEAEWLEPSDGSLLR